MIVRLAIAVAVIALVYLVVRNLGARAAFRARQARAWDQPLREGDAIVLSARQAAWWWLMALAAVVALTGRALFERMAAGEGVDGTLWHWILFLGLAAVAARRGVQLSERITVTWERITSSNVLGRRWSARMEEVEGVSETDRTAVVALSGGRVVEIPPWMDGRFWLARELRARLGG